MKDNKSHFDEVNWLANTELFHKSLKNDIEDSMLFNNFFKNLKIVDIQDNNVVVIETTLSTQAQTFINAVVHEQINKTLKEIFGFDCKFILKRVDNFSSKPIKEIEEVEKPIKAKTTKKQGKIIKSDLRSDNTFDNYVESDFNKDAIKMCKMLINEELDVNTIFMYGTTGLGKTHLLHALGNAFKDKEKSVKYVSPILFGTEISLLLQENNPNKLQSMRDDFESVDLLMFDDFQNYGIGNKKATIETIQNILDYRINQNKITIFCSDRPISALNSAFDHRLISRLQMGLHIEIDRPNQKDLLKILNYYIKVHNLNPNNWDDDAKKFITRNFSNSVRHLLGPITRLKFYFSDKVESKYTLTIVSQILDVMNTNKERLTPELIIEHVAKYYRISKKEIIGKSRKKEVVLARHIAIYIIRDQLEMPLEQLGMVFGGRDHSTMISALKKVEKDMDVPTNTTKKAISSINDEIYRLN